MPFPVVNRNYTKEASNIFQNILDSTDCSKLLSISKIEAVMSWEGILSWEVSLKVLDISLKPSFDPNNRTAFFEIATKLEDKILEENGYHISYSSRSGEIPYYVCQFYVKQNSKVSTLPEPMSGDILYTSISGQTSIKSINRHVTIPTHKTSAKKRNIKTKISDKSLNDGIRTLTTVLTTLCCVIRDKSNDHTTEDKPSGFCRKPISEGKRKAFHNRFFARLRIKKREEKKRLQIQENISNVQVPPPTNYRIKYLCRFFDQPNLRHILALSLFSKDVLMRQEYFWAKNTLMQLGLVINKEEAKDLLPEVLSKHNISMTDLDLLRPDLKITGASVEHAGDNYYT